MQQRPTGGGRVSRLADLARDPAAQAVTALGITQIVSWGTTLYALGVLGKPIAADTGWSASLVYGGLTLGLLASSAVSAPIGRSIDKHGGRAIMMIGSLLVAVSLTCLSLVGHPYAYLAIWAVLGIAMRLTLYDAAFAALVQVTPSRGRRAISVLTLFGGLASSIFWPIGHAMNAEFGWRSTFLIFAAINFFVCLPLHGWGLRQRAPRSVDSVSERGDTALADAPLEGQARTYGMLLFGLVVSIGAFVFGALAVHLVPLIEASGVTPAAAVALASFKGLAQVAGRVCELVFGKNLASMNLGRISILFLPLSFAVLMLGGASYGTALAFTLLFGVANGLMTIVRGAVPLALFGARGYGEVLGLLATPYLVLNALAPAAFAVIVEAYDYRVGAMVLFAASVLAFVAMELMANWYRRQRS